ncbi:transcriptional repressor NF-X1 isoform X2 [Lingula anatina]|uniref:Transcriptional repressor NF-X1 isoform X2 n=1 Tax=Lingula anatina TaxID=7574 RepID=A0A1S3I9V9_LINAN|nr:transcriptional repressor NF-X1 isoform X2 [Lingula anatina]|eukprot:XP_013394641.1 transcriptional repressor NF-X1 isoform X2 [Lingula anatina]
MEPGWTQDFQQSHQRTFPGPPVVLSVPHWQYFPPMQAESHYHSHHSQLDGSQPRFRGQGGAIFRGQGQRSYGGQSQNWQIDLSDEAQINNTNQFDQRDFSRQAGYRGRGKRGKGRGGSAAGSRSEQGFQGRYDETRRSEQNVSGGARPKSSKARGGRNRYKGYSDSAAVRGHNFDKEQRKDRAVSPDDPQVGDVYEESSRETSTDKGGLRKSDQSLQNDINLSDTQGKQMGLKAKSNKNQEENNGSRKKGNKSTKTGLKGKPGNDENQRGVLIEELRNESYECMVCCSAIRCEAAVWSCSSCFHIFHLYCIKKWARTVHLEGEVAETGWRCPACQNVTFKLPNQYRCFCGRVRDPDWTGYDTPHSCGEVCGKKRGSACTHPCNILCHPGPCPPCQTVVSRPCHCGKTRPSVKCNAAADIKCSSSCDKPLNCGKHFCQKICHSGPCDPCDVTLEQECWCGQSKRSVLCGTGDSFDNYYRCDKQCNRWLTCGSHQCGQPCHPGPCGQCPLSVDLVTHCPCGQTPLAKLIERDEATERKRCTDAVASCGGVCGKTLHCGTDGDPHTCPLVCGHSGPCGQCSGRSEVTCRCGAYTKEMPCSEADQFTEATPLICQKRCTKKRSCGRHKCNEICCTIKGEHVCEQLCGKRLSCGQHTCEEPCHRGNCPPCWHVSFDELWCQCGAEVQYPPIPCGTKPPECRRTCTRQHDCQHEVRHSCHSEDKCPPCATLTEKLCMGGHELRKNIPCHLTDISCGLRCNKELPCGRHKCQLLCHKGACLKEGESCIQPCPESRPVCGHPCKAPCHQMAPCPPSTCKEMVVVKCACGHRSARVQCLAGAQEKSQDFQKLSGAALASQMQQLLTGQSVDLTPLLNSSKSGRTDTVLQCNDECAVIERNKRWALALEIKNPDLNAKLGNPTYSQFLKDQAKQNPSFVASVEKALADLVHSCKDLKQPRRCHPFPPMNRSQRQVVHELAEFYGCQTQSYDNEPKKNVVATATRDKCWLPSVSLTTLVQRELHPKAPQPIPHNFKEEQVRSVAQAAKQSTTILESRNSGGSALKGEKFVDYFDFTD